MDKNIALIPVSGIIVTYNRSHILEKTLESLAQQNYQPVEIIIVDSSDDDSTFQIITSPIFGLKSQLKYYYSKVRGAALQRNYAFPFASQQFLLFFDDDILFFEKCIEELWLGINTSDDISGVNALITNQHYHAPGAITKTMYWLLSNSKLDSYAGKCIGPAWNLLPEDNEELPTKVKVDWLNTTCTLYRKSKLPNPIFDSHFVGYSLMEDLALSLIVGKSGHLYNIRTARIFHDSQPGVHKNKVTEISRMELVNRYYIMKNIINKNKASHLFQLFIFELFQTSSKLTNKLGWQNLPSHLKGKFWGIWQIIQKKY